jgi:hypothetical protein
MQNSAGRVRSCRRQPLTASAPRSKARLYLRTGDGCHQSAAIGGARAAVLPSRFIRRLLSCAGFSHVARCHAILSAETSIEIGEISEADAIGNGADRAIGKLRVAQHTIGAGQSLTEHEGGKCRAVGLKQPLKIAWRDRQMGCDDADRKVVSGTVLDNVNLRCV